VIQHFVELPDARVHAATWSPAAPGVSAHHGVVLVHGLGGSTINWHLVGQPISDAIAAPVTALDLIGFGRTPLDDRRSTIDANVRVVADFMRAHDARVVVGNSMGGSIAVRLAARHPELVDALVLVNPALPFTRGAPSTRGIRNLAVFALASLPLAGPWIMDTRARRLGAAGVVDASLRASRIDPARIDQDVRDALIELTEWRHENGVASRAYHDAIRSLLAYLTTAMAADITAVHVPTLVVHGRDDNLVPLGLANALARQRPEWQVELLDCGHLPPLEAPSELIDVVTNWLAGVAAATG
jgi:pimeloyl-ACP methyl ester carboxylesterase